MGEHYTSKESFKSHDKERKRKPLLRRVLVTIIFLSSVSMCTYQTYELILLYFSRPIETQVNVKVNDVMEFPAVTVCNLNPVRRSRWKEKMNETNNTQEVKLEPSSREMKEHFRSEMLTVSESSSKTENSMTNNFKNNSGLLMSKSRQPRSIKRQIHSSWSFWTQLKKTVEENTQQITSLNQSIVEMQANRSGSNPDLFNIHSNISSLWTSLNNSGESLKHLQSAFEDLESRLGLVELTTSEITQEMTKTKSLLKTLRANMSSIVGVTKNETAWIGKGSGSAEELPPSKDMEAFNDYLKNIGMMERKDIQTLGHQREDFIATCSWQGGICYPSHFEVFQNFMYGNCFTFNTSAVDPSVTGTGPYNGLSLSLFIEQDEYIERLASAAGARVVVHDSNYKPFPDEEGFSVAPGYTTAVFLRKSTTTTMKPMCDPDIETSHGHPDKKFKYSQKTCLKQCLSDEILRECRCSGSQFLLDTRACSNDSPDEKKCVERLERLARMNKLPCYCPTSCSTTTYNPMISSAIWPAEKYLPSLLEQLVRMKHTVLDSFENITDFTQYFRKHFLRVDVFFQELTEQQILLRHSYGVERLLSDIGGQLGLWIGVSVATVYESIETLTILVVSMFNWVQARRMKKLLVPLTEIVISPTYPLKGDSTRNSGFNVYRASVEMSVSRSSLKSVQVDFKGDGSWHWLKNL